MNKMRLPTGTGMSCMLATGQEFYHRIPGITCLFHLTKEQTAFENT